MRASIILIGLGLALGFSTGVEGVEPGIKCEAAKLKEAGKYGFCRLKEESKGLKKARTPVFAKCDSKITKAYAKVESQAAGACPTSGDVGRVRGRG